MDYTAGKWVFNLDKTQIESTTSWFIEPNEEDEEDGIHTVVVNILGAMGGENTGADIQLICAAPDMVEILMELVNKYDVSTGGINSSLTLEEITKIKEVVNLAVGKNENL